MTASSIVLAGERVYLLDDEGPRRLDGGGRHAAPDGGGSAA